MNRRRRGEGTIFLDPKSHRWRGRLYFERKNYWVSGASADEVSAKLAALRTDLAKGKEPPKGNETLRTYLESWLTNRAGIRPKTRQTYDGYIRNHIVPAIGHVRLTRLTLSDVQVFLNHLSKHYADLTVVHVRALLRKALNDAMRAELIGRNVARLVELPKSRAHEIKPLTPAQMLLLREALKGHRFERLYIVAMATGLRSSELRGLTWDALDLDLGLLSVTQGVHRVAGAWVMAPPKSETSRRTIVLPETARRALVEQKAVAVENSRNLVFTGRRGAPLWGETLRKELVAILERADLPRQRFHDLRHLNASLMAAQGVSLKDASVTLGHAGIGITADLYQHLFDERRAEVARRVDRAFDPP